MSLDAVGTGWLDGNQLGRKRAVVPSVDSKKKRTVPQRGIWIIKHLLFGPIQRGFPLESVEICPKCCFERDHLHILSSIELKHI